MAILKAEQIDNVPEEMGRALATHAEYTLRVTKAEVKERSKKNGEVLAVTFIIDEPGQDYDKTPITKYLAIPNEEEDGRVMYKNKEKEDVTVGDFMSSNIIAFLEEFGLPSDADESELIGQSKMAEVGTTFMPKRSEEEDPMEVNEIIRFT